ncbi:MAG: T9SS type A sorting domain-containing protein, partial [Candidatus Eisenbacteria sp.]|nr:T9SS type A sorting domain-containing protein [Candidatus Eisenbacteria bacterium]
HTWGGGSDTTTVDDSLMIPGRKFADSRVLSQPILADLDQDSNIEMLVATNSSYLSCFEWDSTGATAKAERGWPQFFPDIPMAPCIADVDGAGNLEMVIQDQSGLVHLFELPGDADGASLPWPEYGHDPRNTFNVLTPRDLTDRGGPHGGRGLAFGGRATWLEVGPNPHSAISWSLFELDHQRGVRLEVFDLQGRRVRMLVDGVLEPGKYRVPWDGRKDQGARAGSGIYFFRLTIEGSSVIRKVSVVR